MPHPSSLPLLGAPLPNPLACTHRFPAGCTNPRLSLPLSLSHPVPGYQTNSFSPHPYQCAPNHLLAHFLPFSFSSSFCSLCPINSHPVSCPVYVVFPIYHFCPTSCDSSYANPTAPILPLSMLCSLFCVIPILSTCDVCPASVAVPLPYPFLLL